MKALSLDNIKNKIKNISGRHIAIAIAAAFAFSMIAVVRLPLRIMGFSTVETIAVFFVAFVPLFIFGLLVRIPEPSVFRAVKYVCYICFPLILMFTADALFDPNDVLLYPDSFFGTFIVRWILVWWIGTVLVYFILRLAGYLVRSGYSKKNALAVLIYDLAVMLTPQKRISTEKTEGKRSWVTLIICMIMVALGVFIFSVTLFLSISIPIWSLKPYCLPCCIPQVLWQ